MSTPAPPKGSVLLVDDDQAVVDYLLEMFALRGYAAEGVTRPRGHRREVGHGYSSYFTSAGVGKQEFQ